MSSALENANLQDALEIANLRAALEIANLRAALQAANHKNECLQTALENANLQYALQAANHKNECLQTAHKNANRRAALQAAEKQLTVMRVENAKLRAALQAAETQLTDMRDLVQAAKGRIADVEQAAERAAFEARSILTSIFINLFRGDCDSLHINGFELELPKNGGLLRDPHGSHCLIRVNDNLRIISADEVNSEDLKIYFRGSEDACDFAMCFDKYNKYITLFIS